MRLPGLRMIGAYQPRWLLKDLLAGVVLTAILVPQGMAYAELAGLPPITGLYTSVLCLAGYAMLGPSRILVLGPDSSLGPMIAATIFPLVGADGSSARAIALASMLAILVGATMILAGVAKLGFVADLLAKPTQIGYMTGLALDDPGGSAPQAVRIFGALRHAHRRCDRVRGRHPIGRGGRGRRGRWSVRTHCHPGTPTGVAENTGGARRGGALHRGGGAVRPGRSRGPVGGHTPPGTSSIYHSECVGVRPGTAGGRSTRDLTRRPHRHHLDRICVRSAEWGRGTGEPGDDRYRNGKRRRRNLPGVSGQHQWIADGRG